MSTLKTINILHPSSTSNNLVLNSDGSVTGTAINANQLQGKTVGTAANQIIALDANAKLPAVDGSQLTNIPVPVPKIAVPRYTVFFDATNQSRTNPSVFTKSYTSSHVSFGSLLGLAYPKGFSAGGSFLYQMSVNCTVATPVISYLTSVDDDVYFYLNGTLIGSQTGAGSKNYNLTWNLVSGNNLIQIVHNNSQGVECSINYMVDFFQSNTTTFNPP